MSEEQLAAQQQEDTSAHDNSETPENQVAKTADSELNDAQIQLLVEKAVQKRLAREKVKHNYQIQELLSETETMKHNLDAAKKEIESYRQKQSIEGWKNQAAHEYGVPAEVLRGTTEQEINEHAQAVKAIFSQSAYVPTDGQRPEKALAATAQQEFVDFFKELYL